MKNFILFFIKFICILNVKGQILNSNQELYNRFEKKLFGSEMSENDQNEGSSLRNYYRWLNGMVGKYPYGIDIQASMALESKFLTNLGLGIWENSDNIEWSEYGPLSPNTAPFNVSSSNGTGIGPLEFLKISPSENSTMICGSVSGGLFISKDGGENWHNLGSDKKWNRSGCGDAEFDPSNSNIIFASSGGNSSTTDPDKIWFTDGLYRTLDDGETWKLIGDWTDFGENAIFEKILINPDEHQLGIFVEWPLSWMESFFG